MVKGDGLCVLVQCQDALLGDCPVAEQDRLPLLTDDHDTSIRRYNKAQGRPALLITQKTITAVRDSLSSAYVARSTVKV